MSIQSLQCELSSQELRHAFNRRCIRTGRIGFYLSYPGSNLNQSFCIVTGTCSGGLWMSDATSLLWLASIEPYIDPGPECHHECAGMTSNSDLQGRMKYFHLFHIVRLISIHPVICQTIPILNFSGSKNERIYAILCILLPSIKIIIQCTELQQYARSDLRYFGRTLLLSTFEGLTTMSGDGNHADGRTDRVSECSEDIPLNRW